MKFRYKLLVLFPALVLSSCGYGLKQTYKGIPYASTVFAENYYNVWNKDINPYGSNHKISETGTEIELNEQDHTFVKFNSQEFRDCEANWNDYIYDIDLEENRPTGTTGTLYGQDVKLSALDDSFKYGVESKLFDGQLFCNGGFQNSRVQVEPTNQGNEKGFGILFKKECARASYFMMNFKSSVTHNDGSYDGIGTDHTSNVKLHINFYVKNDSGYKCVPVTYVVNNVKTNMSENHNNYTCFGFRLDRIFENLNSTRIAGFSLQYEKLSDTYSAAHPEENTLHAIMLYEVSFPHSTWH